MPVLSQISAASDGSVFGLDSSGNLYSCQMGQSWTTQPLPPNGTSFISLSAASDGSVWAVSSQNQLWVLTAGQFQLQSCPFTIAQIAVGNSQFACAIDTSGKLYLYTSSGWGSAMTGGPIASVCATPDGFLWGLGPGQALWSCDVATQQWSAFQPAAPEPILSLAVGVEGWMWAWGRSLTLYQYDASAPFDGASQSWIPVPGTPPATAQSISCGEDGTVWALDQSGNVFPWDYTAQNWGPAFSLATGKLTSISVGNADNAWGLNSGGAPCQYMANVSDWNQIALATGMNKISAAGAGNVWAIDSANHAQQSQAGLAAWHPVQQGTETFQSLCAASDGSVWSVDTSGAPHQFVNGAWIPLPGTAVFSAIGAANATTAWAIDGAGALYQFVPGTGFHKLLTSPPMSGLSVGADGSVFGTNGSTAYILFPYHEGPGWFAVTQQGVAQLSAAGVAQVWIIDSSGNPILVTPDDTLFAESSIAAPRPVRRGGVIRFETESVFDENQSTHLWIVNRAAKLAQQAGALGTEVYNLVAPWFSAKSGVAFRDQLCQGLYDADFVAEYNNPVKFTFGLLPTWKSHFYDASTGKNWLFETAPTALTQAQKFFWKAVAAFQQNQSGEAGYNLGLALHYFTDVCQPMHAANFTVLSSLPVCGYHSVFEKAVMEQQSGVTPPAEYIPSSGVTDPGELIIQAAHDSKARWFSLICPNGQTAYDVPPFGICHPNVFVFYSPGLVALGAWPVTFLEAPVVKQAIAGILQNAVQRTAQFLVYWMTMAQQSSFQFCSFISSNAFAMDVQNGHTNAGNPIQQYWWNNTPAQTFRLQPLTGADAGFYTIATLVTQYQLVLDGANPAGLIQAAIANPQADSQKWEIISDRAWGGISLRNKANHLVITANSSLSPNQLTLSALQSPLPPAQTWFLAPSIPVNMRLCYVGPSLSLDIRFGGGAGSPLWLWGTNSGDSAQQFLWVPLQDEAEYSLLLVLTGPALVVNAGPNGPILDVWNGSDTMKWKQVPCPTGPANSFTIQNKATRSYMAVPQPPQSQGIVTMTSSLAAAAVWLIPPGSGPG